MEHLRIQTRTLPASGLRSIRFGTERNGKKPETAVCTALKLLGPESGRGNGQTEKPRQTPQFPEEFSPGQQRE